MDDNKLMPKWIKGLAGTVVAGGLIVLIKSYFGWDTPPMTYDFSIILTGPIVIAYIMFLKVLISRKNESFLPSNEGWNRGIRDIAIVILVGGLLILLAWKLN